MYGELGVADVTHSRFGYLTERICVIFIYLIVNRNCDISRLSPVSTYIITIYTNELMTATGAIDTMVNCRISSAWIRIA